MKQQGEKMIDHVKITEKINSVFDEHELEEEERLAIISGIIIKMLFEQENSDEILNEFFKVVKFGVGLMSNMEKSIASFKNDQGTQGA